VIEKRISLTRFVLLRYIALDTQHWRHITRYLFALHVAIISNLMGKIDFTIKIEYKIDGRNKFL